MKFQSGDPTFDFSRYPDREVLCIGIPYPGSKLVEGVWYFHHVAGDYVPFAFQSKVQEIVASCRNSRALRQADGAPQQPSSPSVLIPVPIALSVVSGKSNMRRQRTQYHAARRQKSR